MDWIVQNARNTDVERQHLNKILAEIRASIVKVEGEVKLVVNKSVHDVVGNMLSGEQTGIQVWYDATKSTINFRVPNFTIRLTGDVTGTGTVSALTDVNIVTTLDSDVGIPDAPNTGDAFWRRSQEWEQIPALIESLSSLPDNGLLVATDTGITNREIEGPMSVVVTDGDGVAANPSVSLVNDEVSPGVMESYATDMTGTKGWYKPALFESTGLLQGCALSVNAGDNTKFDIAAGIVGYTSYVANPAQPTRAVLQVGPFSAVTVTNLAITATYVGIQMPGGTVVQQATPYTATQTRTIVPLGAVISNGTNLIAVNNLPNVIRAGINQIQDFMAAIGPINISGNKITPNGVNLQLNKSAGVIFKQGSNFNNDNLNPHGLSLASLTAFNFNYRLSDGTQFAATNVIDPSNFENPLGVLTPVTAANRFTIQRITVFTSNLVRVQYGQFVYNTMAEAESALATESFVTETNIAENGILLAFLIVQDGATDLSDPAQAKFIPASKFGGPVGTGGTSILNTDALPEGVANLYFTDARAQGAVVIDSIADADTTHAPSRNAVFDALALKADLASPTFTGDPKAPTPLTADNDTSIATTAFVKAQGYGTGSVTSVAVANATGISWTGSPITGSGTFTPTLSANLQSWSGIAPATKADDNLVVHLAGTETITGSKTFTAGAIRVQGFGAINGDGVVYFGDGATDDYIFKTGSSFQFNAAANTYTLSGASGTMWHSGNDGAGSGLDADLLDGIDSTRVIYGSNAAATSSGISDMNTPVKSGPFERTPGSGVGNSANGTDSWNWAWHFEHSGLNGYGHQLSNIIGTNDLYIRNKAAGTWSSWNKFWHNGNFNPSSYQLNSTTLTAIAANDGLLTGNELFIVTGPLAVSVQGFTANSFVGRSSTGNLTSKPITDTAFNALSNMANGTFTPTVIGSVTAGTGTYTVQNGTYIRMGNVVHFRLAVGISAHTGSGNIRIGGLPFTSEAQNSPVSVGLFSNLVVGTNQALLADVFASSTQVRLLAQGTGGGSVGSVGVPLDTAFDVQIAGTYFTA